MPGSPEQAQKRQPLGGSDPLQLGHVLVYVSRFAAWIVLADDVQDGRVWALVPNGVQRRIAQQVLEHLAALIRVTQLHGDCGPDGCLLQPQHVDGGDLGDHGAEQLGPLVVSGGG